MAQDAAGPNGTSERRDSDVTGSDPAQMQEAVREQTQDAGGVAPAGVAITPGQAKGGLSGGLAGAFLGGLIGVLIGLLPLFDMSVGVRMAIVGGVLAVAGSTVGALLGGFFEPDREGETGDLPGEGPRDIAERRSGHAE